MFPWKMGAIGLLFVLLIVGLLFFIILEYEWIRLAKVRIERERQELSRGGG